MEELAHSIIVSEEVLIILLLVAASVAIFTTRFRLPYTVGLVLIGLALTFVPSLEFTVNPEIIMFVLVPPLIFEAAFHIHLEDLRRDGTTILLLAVVGVLLNMFIVAGIVSWGTGMALQVTLLFGALIAATDPVAVVALFRKLGAPKRLQVLLEGESLFNDGTAIVLFGLMLTVIQTGTFDLASGLTDFIRVAGGGLVVGGVLGLVVSQIISAVDDPMVETTLTTVLAFSAFLVGEKMHVSGVLAVVMAGMVNGNIGPRGMSATTRMVVFNFWEYAAFVANSLVFLFIGLTINVSLLLDNWTYILWAILAVLIGRAIAVYGLTLLNKELSWRWRHIMYWGGLRGAISLALVLSLPLQSSLPIERLRAMAFGVVLFTLLVQGVTMERLSKWLRLVRRSPLQVEYERRHARYVAVRASYEYIQRLAKQGLLSEHTWNRLAPLMDKQKTALLEAVSEILSRDTDVEAEELDTARREALRAQRNALMGLLRDGVISEEIYAELVGEIDSALTAPFFTWSHLLSGAQFSESVDRLMMAVVQERDLSAIMSALGHLGVSVAQLPSSGGFLRRRNVTVLIGYPLGMEEDIVQTLAKHAHHRVELTAGRGELGLSAPNRVRVGGAVLFTFDVEAYYEF